MKIPQRRERPRLALQRMLAPSPGWFAAVVVLCAGGCTPLTTVRLANPAEKLQELVPPKPRTPMHMVDVWTDTVLSQPGQPPLRGFGGRIMFFEHPDDKPVVVDGTLTVYLFEEGDPGSPPSSPICRYVFLPEHLRQHYSRSRLGHSYSVWLPVDELGSPRRRLMLISRFEDARTGKVIVSRPVRKTLPGPLSEQDNDTPPETKDKWAELAAKQLRQRESTSAGDQSPQGNGTVSPDADPNSAGTSAKDRAPLKRRIDTSTIDIPPDVAAKIFGLRTSGTGSDKAMPEVENISTGTKDGGQIPPLVPDQPPSNYLDDGSRREGPSLRGTNISPSNLEERLPEAPPQPRTSFPPTAENSPDARSAGNHRPTTPPAQRGPIVAPNFSPGRTQPHPIVWPSPPPTVPRYFAPEADEVPHAIGTSSIGLGAQAPSGR